MRSIDKANNVAKKPEGIGYHSGEEHFKLNPNRKPEMNIHSKDYKGGLKKDAKSKALKAKKETKKEYMKRHHDDLLKYETN